MKKILLVDDVATNLKCVGRILKDEYQIIAVKSGEEAIAFLQENRPDLILLDIYMPDMDGYDVLEWIQSNAERADIPVIFLTAADIECEVKGRAMGAVDFIRKPFMPQVLTESIRKALEKSR